jgi:hypothetical protein
MSPCAMIAASRFSKRQLDPRCELRSTAARYGVFIQRLAEQFESAGVSYHSQSRRVAPSFSAMLPFGLLRIGARPVISILELGI